VLSVSELKAGRKEVLQMKKVLVIVMLIIAMGLVGCPPRYYDRDRHDQDRGHDYEHRDRHDQDRGHDYEHRDRDNDDREHRK
jgi:ABC-type Zn2+ transport system substrate-binding protein/surface adhesin